MAKVQGGGGGAHILLIPYPAQGHMLSLLDLAHLLSTLHDLTITILTTPRNLPLLSPLLSSSSTKIKTLILPFPSYPSLPPNVENAKDLPLSVISFLHLMRALSLLHTPILNWAHSLPNPPTAIISDFFLGWTNSLARDLGIPRITFCPSGAYALSTINYLWRNAPRPEDPEDGNYPVLFRNLPGSPVYRWHQLSPVYRSYVEGDPLFEFVREGFVANTESWGFVFNTFEDLEGVYLDHMKKDLGHSRVWAVGPLNLVGAGGTAERGGPSSVPSGDLIAWLDRQEEGSVVYVCFGSQAALSPEQASAVAAGLERSGALFVWCVRGAGAGAVGPTAVPDGFEQRTGDRGMVIRGWAPQVELLSHRSVGWFLTHCGWNSVMEGIAAGVAMLTWPMGADQFVNARLLEERVRIGVRVCEGRESVPDPEKLGRLVDETVCANREERARAQELRKKASAAVREGGSSYTDVVALVEKLNKVNELKLKGEDS